MSEVTTKQIFDEIVKNRLEIKNAIEACEERVLLKVEDSKHRIDQLEKENSSLREEIEILKINAKKNNIIIFGLKHHQEEVNFEFISKKVHDLLEINLAVADINDFYTLGNFENSPIKLEFTTYLMKKIILQNCSKLKGTHVSISHDLSSKQREIQKLLRKYLHMFKRDKENTCYIKKNILHVNGRAYTINELRELENREDGQEVSDVPTIILAGKDIPSIADEESIRPIHVANRTRQRTGK